MKLTFNEIINYIYIFYKNNKNYFKNIYGEIDYKSLIYFLNQLLGINNIEEKYFLLILNVTNKKLFQKIKIQSNNKKKDIILIFSLEDYILGYYDIILENNCNFKKIKLDKNFVLDINEINNFEEEIKIPQNILNRLLKTFLLSTIIYYDCIDDSDIKKDDKIITKILKGKLE